MQKISFSVVFGLLFVYLLIYKFFFLDSVLYLQIRNTHSKSYMKKNKSKNIFDKLLFLRYKKDLSKFYYYQNIAIVIIAVLCLILIGVSIMLTERINTILFLLLFPVFYLTLMNWEISSTFSKIKSKSVLFKIFVSVFYAVLTFLILFRILQIWHISDIF